MVIIERNQSGEIVTFWEAKTFEKSELFEKFDGDLESYTQRLKLSIGGKSGSTIAATAGNGDLTVDVSCPGKSSVDLMVNDLKETVPLTDGKGSIILSCAVPGLFVIQPANKKEYFTGGEAIAVVEVK